MSQSSSSKKRERPQDASDVGDACSQQQKKTLYNIFTSLQIANSSSSGKSGVGNDAEMESATDLIADEGTMDMDAGASSPASCVDTDDCDSDVESLQLHRSMESDNLLSVLKNGTRKYGRRVDYLVDELIRKSQKTHCSDGLSDLDFEQIIPSSIGPHPLTDRALGKLWPTVVPTMEGAAMMKLSCHATDDSKYSPSSSTISDNDSCMDEGYQECELLKGGSNNGSSMELSRIIEGYEHVSIGTSQDLQNPLGRATHLSNDITHSDWGIEEIGDLNSS